MVGGPGNHVFGPERWQSGRMHRTRNAAYGQPYRGFESPPLRRGSLHDGPYQSTPAHWPLEKIALFRLHRPSSSTVVHRNRGGVVGQVVGVRWSARSIASRRGGTIPLPSRGGTLTAAASTSSWTRAARSGGCSCIDSPESVGRWGWARFSPCRWPGLVNWRQPPALRSPQARTRSRLGRPKVPPPPSSSPPSARSPSVHG